MPRRHCAHADGPPQVKSQEELLNRGILKKDDDWSNRLAKMAAQYPRGAKAAVRHSYRYGRSDSAAAEKADGEAQVALDLQ